MSEWTGRWSDGSKEWTQEWLHFLPELGHEFGDDGQFVMECMWSLDHLPLCFSNYLQILIGWIVSHISIELYSLTKHGQCRHNGLKSLVHLYLLHGHMEKYLVCVTHKIFPLSQLIQSISVKFSLSASTPAVIVLSQLDQRYYRDISGRANWTMDFTLVKEGEEYPISESGHSDFYQRSVHLEADLDQGDYIVYARLDRTLDKNEVCPLIPKHNLQGMPKNCMLGK